MRLGRIEISYGYNVDLDDEEMVNDAKEALYDDLKTTHEWNEFEYYLSAEEDKKLGEGDIPSFLIENRDMREGKDLACGNLSN